jgi:pimeloyl-ACP methyl ester carboxylesterase
MRLTALVIALGACVSANSQVQRGEPLQRKGFFGVISAHADQGLSLTRVVAGSTAASLNLQSGDVLTSVNGLHFTQPAELVGFFRTTHAGDAIEIKFSRGGKASSISGKLTGRPKEEEPNLDVIYDQVVSQGKRIRIIVTKPKGEGKFPTVFLIGGIGAYSVDAPFSTMIYGNVLGPIANAGYVTVRVDKPGQGDSEGPLYKDLGFSEEKDAYLQALRLTKTLPFVDPNRIAIFGHSMGSAFGPLVVDEEPVKALAVSGALFKNFEEYMLENGRRQEELANIPEERINDDQRQFNEAMHAMFEEKLSPKMVLTKHAELTAFVRDNMPDVETYSGVGIPFFRELNETNLAKAWAGAKCDVLSFYDENDFLSGQRDHELIAAQVNKQRPGTAEFKVLPGIDHYFKKTSSQLDSFNNANRPGEFNPVVVDTLLGFLKKEIGTTS